jgi:thiol-disulfide isomerase/thioredoxin
VTILVHTVAPGQTSFKKVSSCADLSSSICATPVSAKMGGRPGRKWAAKLDMYRKVPGDLLEGSKQGSFISWAAIITIIVLFYKETADYFTSTLVSELTLDRQHSQNDMIRVAFNITMMDLKCEFVEVDVVSVLGNNQNVTKFVNKYPVDAKGILNMYAARNFRQKDVEAVVLHDAAVTKSIEELHESGEEAITLDEKTLQFALNENDLVFVDFYAGWCSHCRDLAPTWEVFAKVMGGAADESMEESREDYYEEKDLKEADKLDVPVMIAKVDCVAHHELCIAQQLTGYPTLRLFVKGERWEYGDYRGHRQVLDLVQFLSEAETVLGKEGKLTMNNLNAAVEKHLNISAEEKHWSEALERTRHHHKKNDWHPDQHPGCQIAGSIIMNRVPGNFYIQAFSPHHDMVPHMTNVSHEIHQLTFTPSEFRKPRRDILPPNFEESTRPMNGNVYVTQELHEAYHHYIKLITTNGYSYQVLQSTQLAMYRNDKVPEAKFIIDLSPIAVQYRRVSRHWYDYITSLMAIIGGTFTVVGFFEAGIRRVAKKVSTRRRLAK